MHFFCLGMTIPTRVQSDMADASIKVLTGSIRISFPDLDDYEKTLHVNESMKVSLAHVYYHHATMHVFFVPVHFPEWVIVLTIFIVTNENLCTYPIFRIN